MGFVLEEKNTNTNFKCHGCHGCSNDKSKTKDLHEPSQAIPSDCGKLVKMESLWKVGFIIKQSKPQPTAVTEAILRGVPI